MRKSKRARPTPTMCCRCTRSRIRSAAPRARATRRCQQAPGQARRHRLDHPQPSRSVGRPDLQADRHDPHDDRRDPRPDPLEHGQHPAEGPGDARPDLAARARCRGRQGAEGGRHRGADRHAPRQRPRRADRASCAPSASSMPATPRRRWPRPRSGRSTTSDEIVPGHQGPVQALMLEFASRQGAKS